MDVIRRVLFAKNKGTIKITFIYLLLIETSKNNNMGELYVTEEDTIDL